MIEDLKLIKPGEVRVRLAPSPTGALHIGLARTALFNYLFAKKYQGSFILRIEDTDVERSKQNFEKDIKESLIFLGIEWHEGPARQQHLGTSLVTASQEEIGDYGPYRQSKRGRIYQKYIKKLLDEQKAYFCFCSKEELEAQRQYLMSIGEPPGYLGKCRNLSPEAVEKNLKQGKSFIIRFKTPAKKITFFDLIRGKIEFETKLLGDFSIAKDLTSPLYNLACVIDDFEMKISHVIRGEDHIPNTPKQILLQEALGFSRPKYAHLPLILGKDRTKLSKRHGATAVSEYKKQGYLAEAMINFIALLGWNPGTNKEIFSMASLIQEFSLEKVQKSAAVFNPQKLDWLNGFYIRAKSQDKLTELCLPYLVKSGLITPYFKTEQYPPGYGARLVSQKFKIKETEEEILFDDLKKIVSLYQERLKKLSEISELTDFFFKEKLDYPKKLLRWRTMEDKEIKKILDKVKKLLNKIKSNDWTKEKIEAVLLKEAEKIGAGDRGKALWPLRVALTGKEASAGPFEIAEILGKQKTLERLKEAQKKL